MNNQTVKPELKSPEMKAAYLLTCMGNKGTVINTGHSHPIQSKLFGIIESVAVLECYDVYGNAWPAPRHMCSVDDFTPYKTPLNQITDEDAIEACEIAYNLSFTYGAKWVTETDAVIGFITVKSHMSHHSFDIDFESGMIEQYQDEFNESGNTMNHYAVCDFLRSRGYALPWHTYSVDQLIEAGYMKLREGGGDE